MMNRNQFELLERIKQRYIDTNGAHRFQIEDSGTSASARQFYLESLDDNLVRPMCEKHVEEYSQGSGDELADKMRALRSSSAMTFNILGNHACSPIATTSILRSLAYSIEYEFQLPTLRSGLPANLDAFLLGSSGDAIACEMKMLEWLSSNPAPIKDKYLDAGNYLFEDTATAFMDAASKLNRSDAFATYDFSQMFKHTLALYNAVRAGKIHAYSLVLLNCVWEPPSNWSLGDPAKAWIDNASQSEHHGFEEFAIAMQPICELFADDAGMEFRIEYITTADLVSQLRYPEEERALLQRYL